MRMNQMMSIVPNFFDDIQSQRFVINLNSAFHASYHVDDFIADLRTQGIVLDDRIIRRLIRTEINRTNNNPPVFDLEYDVVLQEAVRILRSNEYAAK